MSTAKGLTRRDSFRTAAAAAFVGLLPCKAEAVSDIEKILIDIEMRDDGIWGTYLHRDGHRTEKCIIPIHTCDVDVVAFNDSD